jgi:hypothetical protein
MMSFDGSLLSKVRKMCLITPWPLAHLPFDFGLDLP